MNEQRANEELDELLDWEKQQKLTNLAELLEEAMKSSDSTMKETIEDYLFLRKEVNGQASLDELQTLLEKES